MIRSGGLVANVYPDTAGVVVVVDASAADTVLSVRDASDLVNYPAGLLLLPGDSLAAIDSIAFGPGPNDPDLVTLTTGLPADLTAEISLDLYELDVDDDPVPVVTYWATVLLDDGDIAETIVDPHWITHLKVGIRERGRQERVVCERESDLDEWLLRRPVRRVPKVDGKYIRPMTVLSVAIDAADLASSALIPTILNGTDTTASPLMNTRINNHSGTFLIRRDGTGQWPGLDTVPPIITAAIAGGTTGRHIDGGLF